MDNSVLPTRYRPAILDGIRRAFNKVEIVSLLCTTYSLTKAEALTALANEEVYMA